MDRQQFIDTLERTLRGGGTPEHIIADNVRYYNGYFADESAKGRSEAEIAEELGDPRLLAKTILEVQETGGTGAGESDRGWYGEQTEDAADSAGSAFDSSAANGTKGFHAELNENGWDVRYGKFKINSWYGYLLIALVVLLILGIIGTAIGGLVTLLAPVALPVILIVLVVRFFSQRR